MTRPSERELLAEAIERFLSGASLPHEWDDVLGTSFEDSEVEAVRQECEAADGRFPSSRPGEYCSDEGATYLANLAVRLRNGA